MSDTYKIGNIQGNAAVGANASVNVGQGSISPQAEQLLAELARLASAADDLPDEVDQDIDAARAEARRGEGGRVRALMDRIVKNAGAIGDVAEAAAKVSQAVSTVT